MDLTLGHTEAIVDECRRQGLLRNQTAYVLATAFWETARTMKPVVEAFWKTEAWRKKNLRYYPWHGRGFVQLTWERNYDKASRELGLPLAPCDPPKPLLIADPDAALRPDIAAKIIVIGMREGWFTGKRLSDFVTLRKSDFDNARRIVNGKDSSGEIASIARNYDAALKAIGYGEVSSIDAPPNVGAAKPAAAEATPVRPRAASRGLLEWLLFLFTGGR